MHTHTMRVHGKQGAGHHTGHHTKRHYAGPFCLAAQALFKLWACAVACTTLRCRYLKAINQSETLPGFKSNMNGVLLDEAVIKAAIQEDKAKEAQQRAAR
jgi:hypothetical protein